MRLDAGLGHSATVIHCPTGERIKRCRWVDDATHQWALVAGVDHNLGELVLDVRQAALIVILPGLVLIDPVDPDLEEQEIEAGEVAHA